MSKVNSVSICMEGKSNELVEVLDKIKGVDSYNKRDLLHQIEERKITISSLDKFIDIKIFIDLTSKNTGLFDEICNISNDYPDLLFVLRKEADEIFIENKIQRGSIIRSEKFHNHINWRLYCNDMNLNSDDVINYITTNLEYLNDDSYDYMEFEKYVLSKFKDVELTEGYNRDNLITDIKKSYELLNS